MTGFLRRVLSPYRGLLILVILLQLGQSFLTMYLPTINSRVIDYGVANADAAYIMHQGILMLGIALSLWEVICTFYLQVGMKVQFTVQMRVI